MAAKRTMLWLLIWWALRLRFQRASVVLVALMAGATIVTVLFAVWFDINTKMSEELCTSGADFYIGPGHGSSMPQQELQNILDQAPQGLMHNASPWLYGMTCTELGKVVMIGMWFESLQKLVPYWRVTGSQIGVSFDGRNAMIGIKLAERLNVQLGDSITLVDHNQRKNLQIKDIMESGDATDNMLIVNLDVAQAWLHQPGKISHDSLNVSNDVGRVENYANRLQAQYSNLEIRPVRKVSASEGRVLDKIKSLMGLVPIVILALSSLCMNTMLMATVGERAREFVLQKALGSSNSDIARQILLETSIIALAAVARGWVLGYLPAQLLGLTTFSAAISLRLPVLPITLVLSLLVAILAAIIPMRHAVSVGPAKVLKGEWRHVRYTYPSDDDRNLPPIQTVR